MRKVFVIAAREYLAAVRTKSFLISLLVLPMMMGGSVAVQFLLKDQVDLKEKRFAVIDRTPGAKFARALETAAVLRTQKELHDPSTNKQVRPAFSLEIVEPSADFNQQRFELSERVRKQNLFGFVEIGDQVAKDAPALAGPTPALFTKGLGALDRTQHLPDGYVLRYQSDSPTYDDFFRWAERVLNQAVWQNRCDEAGIPRDKLAAVVQPVPLVVKGLSHEDPDTGAITEGEDTNQIASTLMPAGLMMLMFMMVLVGSTPLMQGVLEEKMQRIAEVLLGSVRPFELMLGKLLGMVAVSVTLSIIYLAGAYWSARRYDLTQFLSPELLAWFLVFQMLAVLMYGSLFIAIGAACTDLRETQSMMWPVMLLAMIPMFVWLNVVREPNSPFSIGRVFLPLCHAHVDDHSSGRCRPRCRSGSRPWAWGLSWRRRSFASGWGDEFSASAFSCKAREPT